MVAALLSIALLSAKYVNQCLNQWFLSYWELLNHRLRVLLWYISFFQVYIIVILLFACQLGNPTHFATRGHHLRLFTKHVHYDLRKYYS